MIYMDQGRVCLLSRKPFFSSGSGNGYGRGGHGYSGGYGYGHGRGVGYGNGTGGAVIGSGACVAPVAAVTCWVLE